MHFNLKSKGDSHARTRYAKVFVGHYDVAKHRIDTPRYAPSAPFRNGLRARLYGVNGRRVDRHGDWRWSWLPLGEVFRMNGPRPA